MKVGCLVAAALLLSGCAEKLPDGLGPSTAEPGVPTRIELNANPGVNGDAGTGTITARVFDAFTSPLSDKTVLFSASEGTLSPVQAVTDNRGFARTSITAPAGAAVSIGASTGGIEQKTQIAMQLMPPSAPPTTTIPTTTTIPVPTTTTITVAPDYGVTLSTTPAAPVAGNLVTLQAAVVQIGAAPPPTGFSWDCTNDGAIDGTTATASFGSCSFPPSSTASTVTWKVDVTSGTGVTKSATAPMVIAATPAPTVTISCNSPTLSVATSCATSVKVAGVALPSTRITSVSWDWGDGGTSVSSGNIGTHTHLAALTYDILAVVTVSLNPSTGTGVGTATIK